MAKKKLITYNTLKGNRRSFTGDQRKDDYINQQLFTGKFGYDEFTGGLIRLNNPINVSKEDQELGRRRDVPVGVSTEQIAQSYIDGTNKSEEARNAYINYGFDKTVNNPAFQTAAYFTPPGALIGAAGAATRIPGAISEFADDPSLKTGAILGLNALTMTPLGRAAGVRFSPFRDAKSFYKGFKGGLDRAKTSNLPTDRYGFTDFYNTPRLKSPINIPKPTSPFATANKFNIKIPEGLGSIDKVTGKLRPTTANLLSPAARDYMTQEFSKDLDKMASTFNKNKEAGWQKFQDEIIKLNRKEKYKPIAETRARLLKNAENMPQRYGDMDQLPQYIKNNYQYVGFLWEKGLIDANVNKEQLNKLKDNKELVDEYADRQMRSVRGVHLDADEATKDGGTAEQMADQFLFAQPSLPQDKFELRAGRGQLGRGVYTSNAPGLADRFAGRSQGSLKSYVGDMSIVKPGELEGKSPSEIVDFFDKIGRPAKMTEPATGKTYATLNREKDNRVDRGKAFKASLAGEEYSPSNPITSEPDLPEGFGLFDVRTENLVAPDVRYIYQGYNTMAGDTPGQVATERVIIRPQNITPGEKYEKLEGDVFDPTKLGRSSGIRGEAADPKYFSNWDQLYKELVSGGYLPQGEKYKNFISDLANLQKQTNKYGEDQAEAINNIKNKIVNSATFVDDLMPKMKSADPFTDAVAESVYYGPGAPKELISGRQSFLDKIESKRPLSTTGISDQFSPTINYLESLNRPFAQGVSNPLVDEKIKMGSTMTALGDVYLNKTSGLRSKLSGLFDAALPNISSPPSKNPFYNISPSVLGGSPTTSGLLSTFPNRAITAEALKAKSLKDQSVKDDLEYLKQSTFTPTYVYSPSDDILGSPVRNMDVLNPPRNSDIDFKKSSLASFKKRLADNAELARFYADPLNVPAPKTFLGQFEPSQVMGITEDITGKPFTNVGDLEKDVKDILNYDRLEPKEQKSRFGNIGTYSDFSNRRLDLQNALSGRGSMFNLVPSKFRDNLLEDLPTESSQGFYTAVIGDKLMEATNVGQELLNKEFPLKRRNKHVGKFLDWTDQQKDFQRIFYPQQRILKKYGGPTDPPTNPYADLYSDSDNTQVNNNALLNASFQTPERMNWNPATGKLQNNWDGTPQSGEITPDNTLASFAMPVGKTLKLGSNALKSLKGVKSSSSIPNAVQATRGLKELGQSKTALANASKADIKALGYVSEQTPNALNVKSIQGLTKNLAPGSEKEFMGNLMQLAYRNPKQTFPFKTGAGKVSNYGTSRHKWTPETSIEDLIKANKGNPKDYRNIIDVNNKYVKNFEAYESELGKNLAQYGDFGAYLPRIPSTKGKSIDYVVNRGLIKPEVWGKSKKGVTPISEYRGQVLREINSPDPIYNAARNIDAKAIDSSYNLHNYLAHQKSKNPSYIQSGAKSFIDKGSNNASVLERTLDSRYRNRGKELSLNKAEKLDKSFDTNFPIEGTFMKFINPYKYGGNMKKYKNGGDPPKKKPAQLQFDPTSMFNPYGDPTYSLEKYNTAITRDSTNLEEALSPGLIAQMFGMDEAILPSDYADKLGRKLLTNRVNRNILKPYSEKELQDINYRKYGGKSMDVDYEAEGGEVVIGNIAVNKAYNGGIARQYKGSNMFKLEGPSHANGGIGITMQTGGKAGMNYMRMGGDNETSYVFSDAIGKKGNTFADRASKFGNKLDNINTMAMGGEISDRNTAERMGPRLMSKVKDLFNEQEDFKVKNNIDQDPDRMFLGGLAAKFGATALGKLGASAGLSPGLTAAQFLPGAINVAKGLVGTGAEMNLERVVPEMQEYEDFTGLQDTYLSQQDRSLYGLRKGLEGSGATGSQIRGNLQAGLSSSQNNAGQFFSQLGQMQSQSNRQTDNLNYQRGIQADQMNNQMDAMEAQFAAQNDPTQAFSQGLSQLIGTGTGMAKEGFNRKMMEQMFGAMGGGNSSTSNSPTFTPNSGYMGESPGLGLDASLFGRFGGRMSRSKRLK